MSITFPQSYRYKFQHHIIEAGGRYVPPMLRGKPQAPPQLGYLPESGPADFNSDGYRRGGGGGGGGDAGYGGNRGGGGGMHKSQSFAGTQQGYGNQWNGTQNYQDRDRRQERSGGGGGYENRGGGGGGRGARGGPRRLVIKFLKKF